MPVHYAHAGIFLVLAVDGDFTPPELQRVLYEALDDPGVPTPTRVLLDLAGSASMAGKTNEELKGLAALFAANGDRIDRVAILMAGDLVDDLMRLGTAFIAQEGVHATVFRSRHDAEDWLREDLQQTEGP